VKRENANDREAWHEYSRSFSVLQNSTSFPAPDFPTFFECHPANPSKNNEYFDVLPLIEIKSKKSNWLCFVDSIARSPAGCCHQNVTKILSESQRAQHPGLRFSQQLRRGHIDFADLRQARDPGPRGKNTQTLPRFDQFDLVEQAGSRSDQTHFTAEHIP